MRVTIKRLTDAQLIAARGLGTGGRTQRFIDSEAYRYLAPYWWFKTGTSYRLMGIKTVIGSGKIQSNSVYDARLNYNPQYNFDGSPMRGGFPFQRMKTDHKDDILRGAREISGAQGD